MKTYPFSASQNDAEPFPFEEIPPRSTSKQKGFALVVTLTLMVLLSIIALGLLSLSSISLRNMSKSELLATAKANARTGLMVAIGELQKSMGPDQRISANASITDKGISEGSAPSLAQPQLLGVWKAHLPSELDNSTPVDEDELYDKSDDSDDFLLWLVSGDRSQTSELEYPETSREGTVSLIGPGTLTESNRPDGISNYLDAEKVSIEQSPGKTGAFAWAVVDESQKANFILPQANPEDPEDRIMALNNPGAVGLATEPNNRFETLSAVSDKNRSKLLSLQSTSHVDFNARDQNIWHDLTTFSKGVLTDVVNGGLKTDLSLLFANEDLPTDYSSRYLYSNTDQPAFEAPERFPNADPIPSPDPKWSLLHSHYNLYQSVSENSGSLTIAASNTEGREDPDFFEEQQLYPVVSNAQFIFSLGQDGRGFVNFLNLWIDTVITLWNPYNVELTVPSMEFEFYRFPLSMRIFRERDGGPWEDAFRGGQYVHLGNMFYAQLNSDGEKDVQLTQPYRIRLGDPFTLQPGEYKVFGNPIAKGGTGQVSYHFKNWNYLRGLYITPGYNPTETGFNVADIAIGDDGNGICDLWKPNRVQVESIPNRDRFSVAVKAARLGTNSGFPEANNEELVAYLKIFSGEGGALPNMSDNEEAESRLNENRKHIGSIKIQIPTDKLSESLPSYERDELPTFDPDFRSSANRGAATKKPFLISSLRLRTEEDIISNAPNEGDIVSPWLHNFNNSPYFASGITDDQNLEQGFHSYEFFWEPFTSYTSIPGVEFDDEDDARSYGGKGTTSSSSVNFAPTVQIPVVPASSIAQLSHAPINTSGAAPYTTQVIGNSFASPMIELDKSFQDGGMDKLLDHSFMANNSLFDSYFFSTFAKKGGPLFSNAMEIPDLASAFFEGDEKLSNTNLIPSKNRPETVSEDDYATIAKHLYYNGAFNVNSVSEDAWFLFLSSGSKESLPFFKTITTPATNKDMLISSADLEETDSSEIPFSRFTPMLGDKWDGTDDQTRWTSHRALTPSQVKTLATEVVKQVRLRGPFQSLSEFVNRQISEDDELASAGALQRSIDLSGINDGGDAKKAARTADEIGNNLTGSVTDGSNSFLTQADILNRLGPSLTVRGDTFVIRAYGEASEGGQTVKVWCEAVVQRTPQFVDPTEPEETKTLDLNPVNSLYGRRFEVISFRWLSKDEV